MTLLFLILGYLWKIDFSYNITFITRHIEVENLLTIIFVFLIISEIRGQIYDAV